MDLKNQVISLETAKRLKELGVKRESLFQWGEVIHPVDLNIKEGMLFIEVDGDFKGLTPLTDKDLIEAYPIEDAEEGLIVDDMLPAYTVAELGGMLPMWISHNDLYWYPEILPTYSEGGTSNDERYFRVCYYSYPSSKKEMCLVNETDLAEALAKLLILLIKNNFISVETINK